MNDLDKTEPRNKLKSCIQWLPTEVFRIIQEYSGRKDYRGLLNSSRTLFGSIKYETAHFVIKVPLDVFSDETKRMCILDRLAKVKDPSKQITMEFSQITELQILNYCRKYPTFFGGIYELSLKSVSGWSITHLEFSLFKKHKTVSADGFSKN
jgi:hypothetical protein